MAVAPYLYNGWGSPPNPVTIMNATGVKWFTLAFVLSNGTCTPQWDGARPLTGGVDQQTITTVRANGGDVIPSFGGYSGNKLESSCTSASALMAPTRRSSTPTASKPSTSTWRPTPTATRPCSSAPSTRSRPSRPPTPA